jgi:hypothetical protein
MSIACSVKCTDAGAVLGPVMVDARRAVDVIVKTHSQEIDAMDEIQPR